MTLATPASPPDWTVEHSTAAILSAERIAAFTQARAEMIERIKLRDQLLVAYVAALGAFYAFVLHTSDIENPSLIDLAVAAAPLLISTVIAMLVLQHHSVIGRLNTYIKLELWGDRGPPIWDTSAARNDSTRRPGRTRAQVVLFLLPGIYLLVMLFKIAPAVPHPAWAFLLWLSAIAGVTCWGGFIGFLHIEVDEERRSCEDPASNPHVRVWRPTHGKPP